MSKELTALEVANRLGIRLDGLYVSLRSGRFPGARKTSDGEWKIPATAFGAYQSRRKQRRK